MNAPTRRVRVCLVNGSLRGQKATSYRLLDRLSKFLDTSRVEATRISARARFAQSYPEEDLATLANADVVVFAFPLFVYCLSGAAIRLLEEWARFASRRPAARRARVYVIVNCASAMPEINAEAVRVVKNFCARLGLEWRFAVAAGCGPAVLMTAPIDLKLRRALRSIAADIQTGSREPMDDVFITPMLPRILMDTVRQHLDRQAARRAAAAAMSRAHLPRHYPGPVVLPAARLTRRVRWLHCCIMAQQSIECTGTPLDVASAAVGVGLSHPIRVAILRLLAERGEMCSCEIEPCFDVDPSGVSRHLSALREAGLIVSRRDGVRILHRPASECVAALLSAADRIAADVENARTTRLHGVKAQYRSGAKCHDRL